jgi:hypothetical protein
VRDTRRPACASAPPGRDVLAPIRPHEDIDVDEQAARPAEVQEPDDDPEHPAEEARAARPSRDPGAPTQAQRDAHAATHLPFRSWCDECVQGRRDAPPHCRQKRSAGEIPEVAFDYAFIRRDDEAEVATVLVMRDRDSKAIRAWVLERKGVDMDETVDRAVAGVRELGYRGRVLIRCDGEPALVALRNAITAALPDGATPIATPVGESASNGGIEGAIKILKGLLRVHLAALERRIGAKFPSDHPVVTWLVEHVSDVISKYMVGVDGKTAYERLYGRPVREEGLEFGESLHWRHRPTKDMNVVLDTRWSSGVWLGRKWGGIVHQIFANGSVHEVRGVQRQPRDLRWQKELLEVISSTPWCREPAAPGELRVLPPLAPPAAGAGVEVPEVADAPEYNPHRVFIKLADLERHGFTAGCRRCILMREGRRAQGVKHQDACRDRVEQALRDAGDPRLDRAEARVLDELERRAAGVEVEAPPPPRGVDRCHAGPPRGPAAEDPLSRVEPPPGAVGVELPPRREVPAWRLELESRGAALRAAAPAALGLPPSVAAWLHEAPAAPAADDDDAESRYDENGDAVMRLGPAGVAELYSPPRVTAMLPTKGPDAGLVAGSVAPAASSSEVRKSWDSTACRAGSPKSWDSTAPAPAASSSEVHCEAAQGRTHDEDDEVAAWAATPAGETFDEITGAVLPPKLVQQARAEEIKFMLDWGVWERVPIADCWRETGRAPIGSKWVDVNKGDAVRPLIRSRFVVKEIATYKSDDFFAATPPLEAFRLLLSLAASSGKDTKIEVLDARKAHLHAFADRTVFTQLPPEEAVPGYCARLVRCLYGTRDAPKRWEAFLAEQLVALGFAKGRASPCCYYHAALDVRCIVHGDDFVLTGSAGALDEVKAGMHKRFLLKELGRLGSHASELKELRVLNRVVRWTREGLKYEADPRHAEIIVQGVVGAEKALSAPGTASKEFDAPGDERELPEKAARLFRSFAARANYLAMDRPDISQATKELCRRMSAPRAADLTALLRVARYLVGAGRLVYEFPWQHRPVLSAYTDSDFAGCVATRRSTSGGAVLLGTHLLKHWASTQKKITLSSGEAELGAVVRGFSEALGLQSVGRDLGVELQPEVHADSSAAIGICRRCGIGKVRHLAVAQLWVQDLVRAKDVRLHKVLGTLNPADLMTKPLPRAEIDGHLTRLGLSRAKGRAETAPRADAEVDKTLVSCRVGPARR